MTVFYFKKEHKWNSGLDEDRIFRKYEDAIRWLEGTTKNTMMGLEDKLDYGDYVYEASTLKNFTRRIFWKDVDDGTYGEVSDYCILYVAERMLH